MHLALFDLDGTLLSGDSEALWCSFLIDEGLLDPSFGWRSEEVSRHYVAGTVNPKEFCEFYASTVSGRHASDLQPVRERFFRESSGIRGRMISRRKRSRTAKPDTRCC